MRKSIFNTAIAAMVLSCPLIATQASAKIKEVKYHLVQSKFEDYPVMEMKYQGGKDHPAAESSVQRAVMRFTVPSWSPFGYHQR